MEKFKICPVCGRHNHASNIECEACETDLSTVSLTDETQLQQSEGIAVQKADSQKTESYRQCENCGTKNAPNARKCRACGEDISDILPISTEKQERKGFLLASMDGEYVYAVPEGKTTIGREAAMAEYLRGKPYVSRNHAVLQLKDDCLTIENLSCTNFTFVNAQKLPCGPCKVKDGDEISLGGCLQDGKRQVQAAYFTVRITSCS